MKKRKIAVLVLALSLTLSTSMLFAQNPEIIVDGTPKGRSLLCYDSIDYEISISPYIDGTFEGCGVYTKNGKWYINPVVACDGVTVFPMSCKLSFVPNDGTPKISRNIVVAKPVVIYPPLEDLVTCSGSFELDAMPLYAGAYKYQWSPPEFLKRPDTLLTMGTISQTQKFTLVITDLQFASQDFFCSGRDSLTVYFEPLPKPEIKSISIDGFTLATKETYDEYQWLYEGKPILGATEPFLVVKKNGNYQVLAGKGKWCTDTSDIYVINNVSIQNYANVEDSTIIYPNPAKDILHIKIEQGCEVNIFSVEGKLQKQSKLTDTIYIGELPKGIYLIQIKDLNGKVLKVDRFIKL